MSYRLMPQLPPEPRAMLRLLRLAPLHTPDILPILLLARRAHAMIAKDICR